MARLLLVDGDADFRDLLAFALAWAGHTVLEASGGGEALAYLRGEPVDAILLDPGSAGEQLVAACGRTPRWAAVPIALISGREDVPELAERLDVAAFLQKPVAAARVRDLVEALVPRRGGPARDGETI